MADEPLTDADIAMHYADVTDETKWERARLYVSQVRQAAELFYRELVRVRAENAAMRPIMAAVAKMNGIYFDSEQGMRCVFLCSGAGIASKEYAESVGDVAVDVGGALEYYHAPDCPAVLAARAMGELFI